MTAAQNYNEVLANAKFVAQEMFRQEAVDRRHVAFCGLVPDETVLHQTYETSYIVSLHHLRDNWEGCMKRLQEMAARVFGFPARLARRARREKPIGSLRGSWSEPMLRIRETIDHRQGMLLHLEAKLTAGFEV